MVQGNCFWFYGLFCCIEILRFLEILSITFSFFFGKVLVLVSLLTKMHSLFFG